MLDLTQWKASLADLEANLTQSEQRLTGPRKQERDKRQVKQKIPQFTQQFNELDSALATFAQAPTRFGLSPHEVEQYSSRMGSLRSKLQTVGSLCQKDEARVALLGDQPRQKFDDSEDTFAMTNQDLYKEHQERQAREDNQLDDISSGLTQLTDIANQQNKKLKYQDTLLGNLHDNVDQADDEMRGNVKRVDLVEVETRGGTFPLLIMVALFILMGFVLFTNYLCPLLPGAKCR